MNTISLPIPVAQSETTAIINMIERAARDPSVDIDKMQRLIEMRNIMAREAAEIAFDEAMSAVQNEMRAVVPDSSNPQTRSKYASYAAIDRVLRPLYTAQGLTLSFDTQPTPAENMVRVVCRVAKGGYSRTYTVDMPADGKGARGGEVMTRTHAVGSALTYGKRYLLNNVFATAVGEFDDDGNCASGIGGKNGNGSSTITDAQADEINALIVKSKTDITKFLTWARAASVADVPAALFAEAKSYLNQRIKGLRAS